MAPRTFLIVNADDFGQSPAINRGIIAAHEHGIVTSASLMVRWPAAVQAVNYARRRSSLDLGLHVDLGEWTIQGGEWAPLYEVVGLENGPLVASEVNRQLEAFRRLVGRDPTHLDSHQHVHLREPAGSVLGALAHQLAVPLRHRVPYVRYCGRFYGQDSEGATLSNVLSVEGLLGILSTLPSGYTELACHPADGIDFDTMYRKERIEELKVLCDCRLPRALAEIGIKLCSFRDLGAIP